MFDAMKDFFSFSLNLENDDLLSIALLYYSMSDDMKLLIVNKIMDSYYSIIFFHILKNLDIITKDEFEYLINSTLDKDQEITYRNKIHNKIKEGILDLRPLPVSNHLNYLMILFGKLLSKEYLSADFETEKCYWKKLYDEILDNLNLPKNDSSVINIFKHVLTNLESVSIILKNQLTTIVDTLAHITKTPPLIYKNHDFYLRLNENLQDFPIKEKLSTMIK